MEENRFSFIVSDESINKYGTRVLTTGIDLSEFRKNPVLFWNHKRDEDGIFGASAKNHYPIGRWENIRMDGENLKADAVLDMNDATGKKVAQKLKDGFLNAASIGIAVVGTSESEEFLLAGQTRPTITQSKLLEISIVDIPANGNAMRLSYEGEMLRFDANEDAAKLNALLPTITLGATLARVLNEAIDETVTDDRSRGDVIADMASAAGISANTVSQILNESIDCPPLQRLEGFAEVLPLTQTQIINAAEADGCEYGTENNSMNVADTVTEALNAFFDKLKANFNLSPKKEEVTEEAATEEVAGLFIELNAALESIKMPAPIDNSAEIQALKESNEAFKATLDEMKSELIQLKGKKGGEAGNDAAPLSNKTTAPTLSAHEKALASAGKFFSKKYKNR